MKYVIIWNKDTIPTKLERTAYLDEETELAFHTSGFFGQWYDKRYYKYEEIKKLT